MSAAELGWGPPRRREVTWWDAGASAGVAAAIGGLDLLRAVAAGDVPPPPISGLLGMRLVAVEEGRVVFACTPDGSAYNPIGTVHGGVLCTLLDSAAGCAVHSTLPAGVGYTSIDLNVKYLRAAHAGAELLATGTVVKGGRRVALAAAELHDPDGRLVATATSSCLVLPAAG